MYICVCTDVSVHIVSSEDHPCLMQLAFYLYLYFNYHYYYYDYYYYYYYYNDYHYYYDYYPKVVRIVGLRLGQRSTGI